MKNNLTPQDLRVGNLVELLTTVHRTRFPLRTGVYAYVNEIRQEKVQMRLVNKETQKETLFIRGYNEILPITIDKTILEEYDIYEGVWFLESYKVEYSKIEQQYNLTVKAVSGVQIEFADFVYLHELQNIYKDLTKEELIKK